MLSIVTHYMLVARTLPVRPLGGRLSAADRDFYVQVKRKLWDAQGLIRLTDLYKNAVIMKTQGQHLPFMLSKGRAFLLHTARDTGTRWVVRAGEEPWYHRMKHRIETRMPYTGDPKAYLD